MFQALYFCFESARLRALESRGLDEFVIGIGPAGDVFVAFEQLGGEGVGREADGDDAAVTTGTAPAGTRWCSRRRSSQRPRRTRVASSSR